MWTHWKMGARVCNPTWGCKIEEHAGSASLTWFLTVCTVNYWLCKSITEAAAWVSAGEGPGLSQLHMSHGVWPVGCTASISEENSGEGWALNSWINSSCRHCSLNTWMWGTALCEETGGLLLCWKHIFRIITLSNQHFDKPLLSGDGSLIHIFTSFNKR